MSAVIFVLVLIASGAVLIRSARHDRFTGPRSLRDRLDDRRRRNDIPALRDASRFVPR